jgi:hypothetical protein
MMYYCFCTESYSPWLMVLIRSLRRVDTRTPIVVHFVGDIARARHALGEVDGVSIEAPIFAPEIDAPLSRLLELRARNVLALARRANFEWLVAMDADLLVRRPLTRLIRSMQLFDFGAVIRGAVNGDALAPHLQVSAALYVTTKRGIPVLDDFTRLLEEPGGVRGMCRGDWFWDQACLAEAVMRSDLRIRSIPRELYLSSRPFDRRAVIWNANFSGGRKLAALKVFQMELKRLEESRRQ